ncbi:MAG: zinc-dependent alcohol dehydrogenase [Bacillota bacterium]
MLALVKRSNEMNDADVMEVPVPTVGAGEVLIKVRYAGICGTDLHILANEFPHKVPVTLGHEYSGEIAALGPEVAGFKIGDRVVAEPNVGVCGTCFLCRGGNYHVCSKKRAPGSGQDGAFAEFVKVPAVVLHKIPESVSFREAALTEPAAVAAHAVYCRVGVKPGDLVVVMGPGPIGLLCAQLAIIAGAKVLIAGRGSDERRLQVAEAMGAVAINIEEADLQSAVSQLSRRGGADVVIEASGSAGAINEAIKIVRTCGRMGIVGIPTAGLLNINWSQYVYKSVDVYFAYSSNSDDWERVLFLMDRRKLCLDLLISHEFPLSDWKTAFELARSGKGIKILLSPVGS